MTKSYVGRIGAVCPVCGVTHETGVALNKKLRDTFEDGKVYATEYKLCPEHRDQIDKGYVALVEVDEDKTVFNENGNVALEDIYRTGSLAFIRESVFTEVFSCPVPSDKIATCPHEVITFLQTLEVTADAN